MRLDQPRFQSDLRDCLRFWSRLPIGASREVPVLARSLRALPVAGLVIATPAVLALVIAQALGLPPLVAATSGIAVLIATTGALHEDGLADTADGLFGGATPARRLEIMRDSRIGTFGALALIVSFAARVGALAALAATSLPLAAAALLATAALSRVAGLLPVVALPPARADGLGSGFGTPDRHAMRSAVLIAGATLLLPVLAGVSLPRALLAGVLAVAAAYALVPLAREKIGGQTGDIAGAAQQMAEIVCLCVLSGAVVA